MTTRTLTADEEFLLCLAAEGWRGTPFCANSAVRGAGVSCHRLVAELYFDAGILPRIPLPEGSPVWSRAQKRSLIAEWLDSPEGGGRFFVRLPAGEQTRLAPGDLLGFRVGGCIHHLGVVLPGRRLAHALFRHGACVVDHVPKEWSTRIAAAWGLKP